LGKYFHFFKGLPAWGVGLAVICGVMICFYAEEAGGNGEDTGTCLHNTPPVALEQNHRVREGSLGDKRYLEVELKALDQEGSPLKFGIVTPPKFGKLTGTPPKLRYWPPRGFVGDDWFVFFVDDGCGSDVGTVLIQIRRRNQPPIARDDHIVTLVGRKVYLDLLKNDRDEDGSLVPGSLEILNVPLRGKVRRAEDGLLYYIPDHGFEGRDYFAYRVADNEGAYSNRAEVTIDVRRINDAPVAVDDNVTLPQGRRILIDVLANDHDGDGTLEAESLQVVVSPEHGKAEMVEGKILYIPDPGYMGQDRLSYRVCDREGMLSNEATVLMQVESNSTAAAP